MANADALSQVPIPESPPTVSDPGDLVFLINHLSHAIVKQTHYYRRCIARYNKDGLQPYYQRKHELSIHQGCLLWGTRVIIPHLVESRNYTIQNCERGVSSCMKRLAHNFVWSLGWIKQLKTKLNICQSCEETYNTLTKAPSDSPLRMAK